MATLVLQTVGATLGSFFGPVGSAIGAAIGSSAGYAIDQNLISSTRTIEGARLSGSRPMSAEEGAPMARVYGYCRVSTTVIWATRLLETGTTERQGAKGGPKVITYGYSASAAFGLCECRIAGIKRIWADGKELDLRDLNYRVYLGDENQQPDPLISAKQGAGNTPAFRGTAYLVLEDLALEQFGNRLPQIQVEVIRPVGSLEKDIRAISIIPGATEFGLHPDPVVLRSGVSKTEEVNRHMMHGLTDWQASIDQLQAVCPNLKHLSLVIAWYCDDLRAGEATIRPGVVTRDAGFEVDPWQVGGLTRTSTDAHLVSQIDGRSAYGGTPSDDSVRAAILDLKARGLSVTVNPFILVDVPAENTLPDPYGDEHQASHPWRGRITPHPAVGVAGSVDQTSAVSNQVAAFCGQSSTSDFTSNGGGNLVNVSEDFGYRRMILHYAKLSEMVGGVDTLLIGSEMRALSTARAENNAFPFVSALRLLAADVRSILSEGTNVVYAADWSEYLGYHPNDGSGDVFFHLDQLWADENISAVGIDNYMPLSDWRDSDTDSENKNPDGAKWRSDIAAFEAALDAGEGFDWYYANDADRAARIRSPITDGAYNKPWVFRYKDLKSWWGNQHFDRIGGFEVQTPTAWQPQSKQVFLMEIGCPAINAGAGQPNVFVDEKSSENAIPYQSSGSRDDDEQRAYLGAHHSYWSKVGSNNPIAPASQKPMVDPERLYVWAWDARPFPVFPLNRELWSDGDNWLRGHWVNGRFGTAPGSDLLSAVFADHGLSAPEIENVAGSVTGVVVSSPASARETVEPLLSLFGSIASDTQAAELDDEGLLVSGSLAYRTKTISAEHLVDIGGQPLLRRTLSQIDELPNEAQIGFRNPLNEYQAATAYSRRIENHANRQIVLETAAIMDESQAISFADNLLSRIWTGREQAQFALPLAYHGVVCGDVVAFDDVPDSHWLVERVALTDTVNIEARSISKPREISRKPKLPSVRNTNAQNGLFGGPPEIVLLDLPFVDGLAPENQLRVALSNTPDGQHNVFVSPNGQGFAFRTIIPRNATIGTLETDIVSSFSGRWDSHTALDIVLTNGAFESADELGVLAGRNLIALETSNGNWEVLQFRAAEEISSNRWRLSELLRAQGGSDDAMISGSFAGARAVLLDGAVIAAGLRDSEIGLAMSLRIGQAGKEFSDRYYKTVEAVGGLRSQRPLSPVHLKARRTSEGVDLTWIRRGRINADSWLGLDIPLGEDIEVYEVDLLDDDQSMLQNFEAKQSNLVLDDATLVEIFGAVPDSLNVRIAQLSQRVGAGINVNATLDIY